MYSLRRGAPDRAKSATACITSLCVASKMILAGFNLAVSTLTPKLPNLIPHQIFQLYGMRIILASIWTEHGIFQMREIKKFTAVSVTGVCFMDISDPHKKKKKWDVQGQWSRSRKSHSCGTKVVRWLAKHAQNTMWPIVGPEWGPRSQDLSLAEKTVLKRNEEIN